MAWGNTVVAARDERLDEVVVALPADAAVPKAKVERVGQQGQVVGAHVQDDRDRPVRVDASSRRVQGLLPQRDLDAAHPLIADPEDSLGVGDDQQVDVLGTATLTLQRALDLLRVVDRQEDPVQALVGLAELDDRRADGRRVDDRHHLVEVLAEQPVEQDRVAIAQR